MGRTEGSLLVPVDREAPALLHLEQRMEVDGTVILTNFVPSDAATIGDGFTERKDLEGRKSLGFQFGGRPPTASAVYLR